MAIIEPHPDSFFDYLKTELEKNTVDHVVRVEPQGNEILQLTVISKGNDVATAKKFFLRKDKIATQVQFLF